MRVALFVVTTIGAIFLAIIGLAILLIPIYVLLYAVAKSV